MLLKGMAMLNSGTANAKAAGISGPPGKSGRIVTFDPTGLLCQAQMILSETYLETEW